MTPANAPVLVSIALLYIMWGSVCWLIPTLAQPTVPFGVRIPHARITDPVIARARRQYRRDLLLGMAGALALAVLAGVTTGSAMRPLLPLTVISALLTGSLIGSLVAYVRAHRLLAVAKAREGWYAGQREAVAAETRSPREPVARLLVWALPALAVIALTLVIGVLRYPHLPPRIPAHFRADGTVDRAATKSAGSAFVLVPVQLLLTALIGGSALAVRAAPQRVDVEDPANALARQHTFRRVWTRALLLLAAGADIALGLVALATWGVLPTNATLLPVALAPTLVIVVGIVLLAVRTGQGGSRLPALAPSRSTGYVNRDDDRYWKGGLVYVNADDPALLVEKRFGVGWTLNFGHRLAWVVLLGLLLFAILPGLLAVRLTH